MKRKLLKCTGTLTLALALAALSATPALAAETGTDAVTGLLSDILVALTGAGSVIAAACIGIRGAREIVQERYAYFTCFSSKGHDLGRLLMQATKEITVVVIYGGNMLEKYESLFADRLQSGIQVNFLMLDREYAFSMSEDYYGEKPEQYKHNAKKAIKILKRLESKSKNLCIKKWSLPLGASYIAIDCGIERWRKPEETGEIQMMLYQYKIPTENSPITYVSKKRDASAFEHTVTSIKHMWEKAPPLNLNEYFSASAKKLQQRRRSLLLRSPIRLASTPKQSKNKKFKKSVAHSALRCFLL